MRDAFRQAMIALSAQKRFVFMTGDLGFMALEELQEALGQRFINAGVAEQNMVSVAAGTASGGEQCWTYSIAPFIYARPFEQIRNDVCLHDADVKLVGNGGGYGYGVMGATHHALEDYGVLCALPNMTAYVPAFDDDIGPVVALMAARPHPAYLRLGRCEKPSGFMLPPYAALRCLLPGDLGILLCVGPGVGGVLAHAAQFGEGNRPEVWVASELPLEPASIPERFFDRLRETGRLAVAEEHVAQGGVGQMLAYRLVEAGLPPLNFIHFSAHGYRSGRYGSQAFHRRENGLDSPAILAAIQGETGR
jgi:transketolase